MTAKKLGYIVPWLVAAVVVGLWIYPRSQTVPCEPLLTSTHLPPAIYLPEAAAGSASMAISSPDSSPESNTILGGESTPELTADLLTLDLTSDVTSIVELPKSEIQLQELPIAATADSPSQTAQANPKDMASAPSSASASRVQGQSRVVNQFVVGGHQRSMGAAVSTSIPSPSPMPMEKSQTGLDFRSVELEYPHQESIRPTPTQRPSSPGRTLVMGLPAGVGHAAADRIEYAKTLARRGAMFSARRELVEALRVIAASLDQSRQTTLHTQQLNRGWAILREAEALDLARSAAATGSNAIGLQQIVEGHTSQVVPANIANELSVDQVLNQYYLQAKQCLGTAVGANTVSAEALHCLGKLFAMMADQPGNSASYSRDQAMVMYSAALDCNPQHHHAANELGVLLASQGHLAAAKERLQQSLNIQATSQAWLNLAEIHQRLGETQLAMSARNQADALGNSPVSPENRLFHWVEPDSFGQGTRSDWVSTEADMGLEDNSIGKGAEVATPERSSWLPKILR